MAHYDCGYCGESASYYPNCCQKQQDNYIKRQKKEWSRYKATNQLKTQHEEEITNLALNLLEGECYEDDDIYLRYYIKDFEPIEED